MRRPLAISLRHLTDENSEYIQQLVRERVDKLERLGNDIIGCHVVVEKPQRFQTNRNPYRVLVRVTVPPNKVLVVNNQPVDQHGSVAEVINATFDAMERRLDAYMRIRRGEVKAHTRAVAVYR